MPTSTDQIPADEFASRLEHCVRQFSIENSRIVQLFLKGRCPSSVLQRYALATLHSAQRFNASLATLANSAPSDRARLLLLQNLLEEEGGSIKNGVGLVVDAASAHVTLAMRFVKACGASSGAQGRFPYVLEEGETLIREERWLEAVAFLLVGQELLFSRASAVLFQALQRQGIARRDLAFFAVHQEADLRHGREAIQMVVENAHTRPQQDAVMKAAERGAQSWIEHHGGLRGASRRDPEFP